LGWVDWLGLWLCVDSQACNVRVHSRRADAATEINQERSAEAKEAALEEQAEFELAFRRGELEP
jgi:hypothetical protein